MNRDSRKSLYFDGVMKQIKLKLSAMRDADLMLLLQCFTERNELFDQNMVAALMDVIKGKVHQYKGRSLVDVVWSLTRLDMQDQ